MADERTDGRSKAEMLRDAKAQFGDKKPEGNEHKISGQTGGTVVIRQADLPDKPVLAIEGNTDTVFELAPETSVIKVLVSGCRGCTIKLPAGCRIITSVLEVWSCADVILEAGIEIGTLQIDLCEKVQLMYTKLAHLGQLVQAGVHRMTVAFGDAEDQSFETGIAELRAAHKPELSETDRDTQFVTRLVDGQLLTEEIIRLANDFPTTHREKALHDAEAARKEAALGEIAATMLSGVGDKLGEAKAAEIQKMVGEVAATSGNDGDTGDDARARYKRELGTEQFKLGEFQQAAVHYTESIGLDDTVAAVWANRAMCWLKLAQPDKALADCDRCLSIDASYTKAHFRRGVALLEKGDYINACKSFRRTLELDPKNAQAKSSMMLAEKKLSMSAAPEV